MVVTGRATGSGVTEGHIKAVSSLTLGQALTDPRKASAIIVATAELIKFSSSAAIALFNNELQSAVAYATDEIFITTLLAATTPTASAGDSAVEVRTDLKTLLAAVDLNENSRVYFLTDMAAVKALAMKGDDIGGAAFPNMTVNGGTIGGVTVVPSLAMPSGSALLVVADGIVGDSEAITLDATSQADLQFDTAPDSPAVSSTVLKSLWSSNAAALRAERYFGFDIARSTAVASLSSVSY